MLSTMLTLAGAFGAFHLLPPLPEAETGVNPSQLALLLLGLGMAGFTLAMLASGQIFWAMAAVMVG